MSGQEEAKKLANEIAGKIFYHFLDSQRRDELAQLLMVFANEILSARFSLEGDE